MTSSLADSDLQAALVKSQRGITKLKDIVVKKFEDKPDNPRLGFCDFLKVEVVQLTSDSYDEFQQETFNLLMRLKCRDKQQQRYQQGMGTRMAQTVTYSQASTSHLYPVPPSDTQMQTPHQQMQQTFTHCFCTAAITVVIAALSTDIHTAACTSSAADPRTRSTAKHHFIITAACHVTTRYNARY